MAAALLGLAAGGAAIAAAPAPRILQHEAIVINDEAEVGSGGRVSFEAYGRRFDLLLQPNEAVRRALPPDTSGIEPFKGTVEGAPGSWVRLTRTANGWSGLIAADEELYAIEPAADIAESAVQPLTKSGSAPVVYRLADTLMPLGPSFCGTVTTRDESVDEQPTALETWKSISSELHAQAAQMPRRRLTVGVVADYEFAHHFGAFTTPEQAIVARMNVVHGIFSEQLGVEIELAPATVYRRRNDPFTSAEPRNLLDQVRRYRRGSPEQLALGLTHLMTGRDMSGRTVGIAYMGSVCAGDAAASLSEGGHSLTMSALIAAHELGHNLDAPHDGESGDCAATPQTFLMAPRLNGSDQFSACSIQRIQPVVATRSCFTTFLPADAGIEPIAANVQAQLDAAFTLAVSVHAMGDEASEDVVVTATLPPTFTLESASAEGAACTSGAGTVSCSLGTLSAGSTQQVSLSLQAGEAGSFTVPVTLTSMDDAFAGNDSSQVTVNVSNPRATPQPVQAPSGGGAGGGGGQLSGVALLLLLVMLSMHRRSRQKPRFLPAESV